MPFASCAFRSRFAIAVVNPGPIGISAFWLTTPTITGVAVLRWVRFWKSCAKAPPKPTSTFVNGVVSFLGFSKTLIPRLSAGRMFSICANAGAARSDEAAIAKTSLRVVRMSVLLSALQEQVEVDGYLLADSHRAQHEGGRLDSIL